jgi:uncharacterized protein (TIGR03086 family)
VPIENLTEVQHATSRVLSEVTADQMTDVTPCSEWDDAGVIDHLVGVQFFFGLAAGATVPSLDTPTNLDDFRSTFNENTASVLAGVSTPDVGGRAIAVPFGEISGDQSIDFASLETLTHAWDIARATAQGTDLAPATANQLLDVARAVMGTEGRAASSRFGPVQVCEPTGSATDRLAAYLGRCVD